MGGDLLGSNISIGNEPLRWSLSLPLDAAEIALGMTQSGDKDDNHCGHPAAWTSRIFCMYCLREMLRGETISNRNNTLSPKEVRAS